MVLEDICDFTTTHICYVKQYTFLAWYANDIQCFCPRACNVTQGEADGDMKAQGPFDSPHMEVATMRSMYGRFMICKRNIHCCTILRFQPVEDRRICYLLKSQSVDMIIFQLALDRLSAND